MFLFPKSYLKNCPCMYKNGKAQSKWHNKKLKDCLRKSRFCALWNKSLERIPLQKKKIINKLKLFEELLLLEECWNRCEFG